VVRGGINDSGQFATVLKPAIKQLNIFMSNIFHTASRQVSARRWVRLRELESFMRVPVWALGLKGLWQTCFLPLHRNIARLWKASGPTWLVSYLKECVRIIVYWASDSPYSVLANGVRVSRARSGLPLLLPAKLRYVLASKRRGSLTGWMALRGVLSVLTVYRVIGCRPVLKIETITDSFCGLSTTLPFEELRRVVALYPGSLLLKPATPHLMSEAAGPNYPRATWSSGLDALAFLANPLIWASWIVIAVATRSWMLLTWQLGVVILSAPVIPLLVLLGNFPVKLGRLAKLFEGAGKVRVIAITDWWTQCLLLPLHSAIFESLKLIDQDGTHNQIRPLKLLSEIARGRPSYSFDLSAATDRLPIDLQVQVLKLLGVRWADAWAVLLT
jgi:hypothetical protein